MNVCFDNKTNDREMSHTPNKFFQRGRLYSQVSTPHKVFICTRSHSGIDRLHSLWDGNLWSSHRTLTAGSDTERWVDVTEDFCVRRV